MTTEVAVRECEPRDLDEFGRFGSERHLAFCLGEFAQPHVAILVAVDRDDVALGKIHVHLRAPPLERVARVVAAAVAAEHRNRGIGTTLIRAAEELAGSRGFPVVEIGVEDSNPDARRLYERLGYEVVGPSEFLYDGAPAPNPGVLMRREVARSW